MINCVPYPDVKACGLDNGRILGNYSESAMVFTEQNISLRQDLRIAPVCNLKNTLLRRGRRSNLDTWHHQRSVLQWRAARIFPYLNESSYDPTASRMLSTQLPKGGSSFKKKTSQTHQSKLGSVITLQCLAVMGGTLFQTLVFQPLQQQSHRCMQQIQTNHFLK